MEVPALAQSAVGAPEAMTAKRKRKAESAAQQEKKAAEARAAYEILLHVG